MRQLPLAQPAPFRHARERPSSVGPERQPPVWRSQAYTQFAEGEQDCHGREIDRR
jgi:hypothetical protein